MPLSKKQIRERGDRILHKMSAVQNNYGTGKPDCFTKSEWEAVTTKKDAEKKVCDLWRELNEIDPERASIVKPQNPHVR